MKITNHSVACFRKQWVFLVLSFLALFLAFYSYQYEPGDFRMLALVTSSSILIAGILKIIFSRANKKEYKRAGWYFIGGIINIILSAAFFYYYFSFYENYFLSNKIFLVFIGFWLLMHSFLNYAFAKELNNLNIPAVFPFLIVGIIGSFASIAVILFALVEQNSAIPAIIITLIVISIYNGWIFLYMKKNPIRN